MKCGLIEGRNDSYFKIRSGYDTERASDELRLANNVRLRPGAIDLPVHCLECWWPNGNYESTRS
jgi:hypothetical protein